MATKKKKTSKEIDNGADHIKVELEGGTITVRHGSNNEILHEVENAEKGSWSKMWEAIRAIKSVK